MSISARLYELPDGQDVVVIVGGAVVRGTVAPRTDGDKPYLVLANATINGGVVLSSFQCARSDVQGFGIPQAVAPSGASIAGGKRPPDLLR